MDSKIKLKKPLTFDWDKGNKDKNVSKHNVENSETEEIFINVPVILPDWEHSQIEERYFAFGKTDKGRYILVTFTLRGKKKNAYFQLCPEIKIKKNGCTMLKRKRR